MMKEGLQRIVNILGVPLWHGQKKYGVNFGPKCIRKGGLIKYLNENNIKYRDLGDLKLSLLAEEEFSRNSSVRYPGIVGNTCHKLSEAIRSIASNDENFVLTLGGDHSLAAGSIHGHLYAHKNAKVLWVDAHADINTPQTTHSGNLHGTPMAMLIDETSKNFTDVPGWDWHVNKIPCQNIAYIALRDVDYEESLLLQKYSILSRSMQDIRRYGLAKCVEEILQKLKIRFPLLVQFDIDSLDPSEAASTGTPVNDGLSLEEGIFIVEQALATGFLKGLDLVEVNPKIGTESQQKATISAANKIILASICESNELKKDQKVF